MKEVTVGDFEKNFKNKTKVKIQFAGAFCALVNGEIVAPDSAIDRKFEYIMDSDDHLEILTEGRWTMKQEPVKFSGEIANTESLTESIEDGELSMFERMKSEIIAQVSNHYEQQGYETEEEANDFEWEDEDGLIDTPYEYEDMKAEFPINAEIAQNPSEELDIRESVTQKGEENEENTKTEEV